MTREPANTCPDIDRALKLLADFDEGVVLDRWAIKTLSEVCDILEELRSANADLRDCYHEAQKEYEALSEECGDLEDTIDRLRRDIHQLQYQWELDHARN